MALSEARQARLNPILDRLRQIAGVSSVFQDDFDSASVNVFLPLRVQQEITRFVGGPAPAQFAAPLRRIKGAIKAVAKDEDVLMRFLHQPSKQYEKINGTKYDAGYDSDCIKIEVFV